AGAAQSLIVITPHIEPIRAEFGDAFTRWHARTFPTDPPATIDWRVPGGTSEIVKQLSAQYEAALKNAARPGKGPGLRILKRSDDGKSAEVTLEDRSMATDVMLGGGSFEHNQLKRGITAAISLEGQEVAATVR